MMNNKAMLVFVSLLIIAAVFLLILFTTYHLACFISPPYIVDENGEEHGLMPIGQAIISLILAMLGGAFSLLLCYKKLIRKKNT